MSALLDKFRILKSDKKAITSVENEVFFQLNFDDLGVYVLVVNNNGITVTVDARRYHGPLREALRSYFNASDSLGYNIDWDEKQTAIYLHQNPVLLNLILRCETLVDENMTPIVLAKNMAYLCLSIVGDDLLTTRVELHYQNEVMTQPIMISENHAYVNHTLYPLDVFISNPELLHHFETQFPKADLEPFLSLLYSRIDAIPVRYLDFQTKQAGSLSARESLIVEKIDQDQSLHIRIAHHLASFDPDFLDDFDISQVVTLNELENTLMIQDIIYADLNEFSKLIVLALNKYKKRLLSSEYGTYFQEEKTFILEKELAELFVQFELPKILETHVVFGAEKLKEYKISFIRPNLNLSLDHGIDFLEGSATLDFDGEHIPLFDVLDQYKKNAYVLLSNGQKVFVNNDYISKLQRVFKNKNNKVKLSFFDLPIIDELIDAKISNTGFEKAKHVFSGFNTIKNNKLKIPKLSHALRPYQVDGVKWLNYLHKHSLGGCLADDMGLGKTLQTIALLSMIYPTESKPSLVIMPKSLLFNWQNELQKFNPALRYYVYYNDHRDLAEAKKHHLILTTYGHMRSDIDRFKETDFYYVILDESTHIKNTHSQASKAVMLLNSTHRLALSGTPIENNLGELYSLFRFLNPTMFGSAEEFKTLYLQSIQKDNNQDVLHELRLKIYPFILRRLKKNVLKDLPDKVEQTLFVEMAPKQKTLYEQRRQFYYQAIHAQISAEGIAKSQFFIFQALNELRQIASIPEGKSDDIANPKKELLLEHIIEAVANGHKILVFANFLQAIDSVGTELEKANIPFLTLTGASRDREQLVNSFQNDTKFKVFLITIKTGGMGLNLTAADMIFIFDPWWNKSVENQAIDRAHRIGQDRTVFSYKLIAKDTIEEKILLLQQKKSELVDSLITTDSASIKVLAEEDIDFMLG